MGARGEHGCRAAHGRVVMIAHGVGDAFGQPGQTQQRLDETRIEVGARDGLEFVAAEQEAATLGIGGRVE
jgi:hypothetical protein